MRSQWFVIHTLSGQEQKVKESIEKRIKTEEMGDYVKEVLVPMEEVVEVRRGAKVNAERKFFPGYVLIKIDLTDQAQPVRHFVDGADVLRSGHGLALVAAGGTDRSCSATTS